MAFYVLMCRWETAHSLTHCPDAPAIVVGYVKQPVLFRRCVRVNFTQLGEGFWLLLQSVQPPVFVDTVYNQGKNTKINKNRWY